MLETHFSIVQLWSKKSRANASLWAVVRGRLLIQSPGETDM